MNWRSEKNPEARGICLREVPGSPRDLSQKGIPEARGICLREVSRKLPCDLSRRRYCVPSRILL